MDTNLLDTERQGDDVDIMGDIEELDGQHFEVLDTVDSAGEGAAGEGSQSEGRSLILHCVVYTYICLLYII